MGSACIEKREVQSKDSGVLASDALQNTFTGLRLLRHKMLLSHVQPCLCHVDLLPEPVHGAFQAREALAVQLPRCGDDALNALTVFDNKPFQNLHSLAETFGH